MATPSIEKLHAELAAARAIETAWKARGSPEIERPGVQARLQAVYNLLAQSIREADAEAAKQKHVEAVAKKPPKARHKPPQQHSSRDVLNKETNARFWAQTGYKIGQKLDPKGNATDRSMAKVWLDIFEKVAAEDRAGHLVTTYDHPQVASHLQEAAAATQVAEESFDQAAEATKAQDPWEETRALEAARDANRAAKESAKQAAAYQPPTVSPHVAATASRDAHQAAQRPPPNVVVFPKGHPVHWHPSAQPAHPDFATPNADDAQEIAPPTTARDELALADAAEAHRHAAEVHERGMADSADEPGVPPRNAGGSRPGKKGLSTGQIVALAIGGVAVAGAVGYAMMRRDGDRASPRRPHRHRTQIVPPLPMPHAGAAR